MIPTFWKPRTKQRGRVPRCSNSEAMTRRREFKLAMRQRVRDIAALHDLSEEEIKPALTLKHHEIARFTEKHGVNLDWLLEGKGRIFKKNSAEPPEITKSRVHSVLKTLSDQELRAVKRVMAALHS